MLLQLIEKILTLHPDIKISKWIFAHLMSILCLHVDPGQPTVINWLEMVPTKEVFMTHDSETFTDMYQQELTQFLSVIDICLGTMHGQWENININEAVPTKFSLHQAHHFNGVTGARIHGHVDYGY